MKTQKIQKEERLRNKRSQASIIITVLLVLLAIAGIVLLSAWLLPMIRDKLATADIKDEIAIQDAYYGTGNTDCGGLSAEECVVAPKTYITIKRATESSANLHAINFVFQIGSRVLTYYNTNVPSLSEYRVYSFSFFGAGKPDSVKIIPVVTVNGRQKMLDVDDEATVRLDNTAIPRYQLESCSLALDMSNGEFPSEPSGCVG
jgi:hypothetical protein